MQKVVVLKEGCWILDVAEVSSALMSNNSNTLTIVMKNSVEIRYIYDYRSEMEKDFKKIIATAIEELNKTQKLPRDETDDV